MPRDNAYDMDSDNVSNIFTATLGREPTLKEINMAELNMHAQNPNPTSTYTGEPQSIYPNTDHPQAARQPTMSNLTSVPEALSPSPQFDESPLPGQMQAQEGAAPFPASQQHQEQQFVSNHTDQNLVDTRSGSPGYELPNYHRSPTQQLLYRGDTKTTRLRANEVKDRVDGKVKKKATGFCNKSSREVVWKEMGNLKQDPYDSRVNAELVKATRARNSQILGFQTKHTKATKLREFKRLDALSQSVHTKREAENKVQKAKEDSAMSFHPRIRELHRSPSKMASMGSAGGSEPADLEREFTWKPPKNFKVFDPTEYGKKRQDKIAAANLNHWQPENWNQIPDKCYKPTRDIGECD